MTTLAKRHPNWLPIPHLLGMSQAQAVAVDLSDNFPKGQVIKFFPDQDYGFIKDQHGHDIYFNMGELDLVGPKNRKDCIKVGAKVGYDLSWTSKGQHVRKMKVY